MVAILVRRHVPILDNGGTGLMDLGSELDGAPQKLKGYIIGRGVTLENVPPLNVLEGDRLHAVLVLIPDPWCCCTLCHDCGAMDLGSGFKPASLTLDPI